MKKLRGIISTVLIISALVSLTTGAILYFLKYGMWLIFTRIFLSDTHAISGLIMGIAITSHFIINYRMYVAEIKEIFRRKPG